jgi:hypothetical protein
MFTRLKTALDQRRVRQAEADTYRRLLRGGPHILRDIGVTEADLRVALTQSERLL